MRQPVESALASSDPEERRRAVARLETEVDEASIALLVAALGDEDWRVRKEGVRVASVLASERRFGSVLIPALVTALGARENVGLRNAAVEALSLAGNAVVAPLLSALPAMSADTRRFAVEVFGEAGDARAVPALVGALEDPEPNVRYAAAEALGRLGGPQAETALRGALDRDDDLLRLAALEGLNRLEIPIDFPVLRSLVERRVLRQACLMALGRCTAREAVPVVANALLDRTATTAAAAAVALSRIVGASGEGAGEATSRLRELGGPAIEFLSQTVRKGTEEERLAAVRLLGTARHPDGLAAVVEAAGDDSLVREVERAVLAWGPSALDALLLLLDMTSARAASNLVPLLPALATGRDPTPVLRRLHTLLGTDEDALAAAAADAMGRLVATDEIDALLAAVRRGGPRTVRAACRALHSIAAKQRQAVRAAVLDTPLEGVGADAICEILAAVAEAEDAPILRAALASENPRLRRAAVDGLAALGGPEAEEAIPFALTDEAPEVQAAAARALGRLGGPRAGDSLLAVLGAPDPRVRAAAARGLADAHEARAVPLLRERVRSDQAPVALACLEALSALADPGLGDVLVEALGHPDAEVVKQALRSLAAVQEPRAANRIAIGLDHASWDVRRAAASLLGRLKDEASRGVLEARLACEEDGLVRAAIEEALGRLPGREG